MYFNVQYYFTIVSDLGIGIIHLPGIYNSGYIRYYNLEIETIESPRRKLRII